MSLEKKFTFVDKYPSSDRLLDGAVAGIVIEPNTKHTVVIGDWFSPLEFHVIFKKHLNAVDHMLKEMNEVYEQNENRLDNATFDAGKACVVKGHDGEWYRAVLDYSCTTEYGVKLVDQGSMTCVPVARVKKLLEKYGKIPPLAVPCTLAKCQQAICYREILEAIGKNCTRGKHRKMTFKSAEFPLEVDLFSMNEKDLFQRFFGPLLTKQEMAKKQREEARINGQMKNKKKPIGESSTDEEDYDYESDEDQFDTVEGVARMTIRKKQLPNIESFSDFPPLG